MGEAQHSRQVVEALTTLDGCYDNLKIVVENYGLVYDIPTRKISAHIERLDGSRPQYLYQILLAVARLKQPSKAMVIKTMRAGIRSAINAIDHLYQHGYLVKVPKPRIIKPFGKYKIDTGYELSEKGKRALYNILFG